MQNQLHPACFKVWPKREESSQKGEKFEKVSLQSLWSPRVNETQVDEAQAKGTYELVEEASVLEVQPFLLINQVLQVQKSQNLKF